MNSKIADIKPSVMETSLNENEKVQAAQVESSPKTSNVMLDKLGIWISSLCALHCLLVPLLLPVAPLIASSFFAEQWFERSILSFSILVGFAALFVGFHKYHRQLYPLYSLALGGLIYWNKDIFGHEFEPITIGIGALLIIVAHVTNLRLCKSCQSCESDCH
jgi:hypothetical protein